ncbi:MAG: 16S rRNA (guanine(966)-N(2))-methyltransferase RsmD [Acidobacteria bacterium]|nr:16S rRNA (guanine(966)-N(2))-methyltransferase RsmD [Acidobacteriota bacterium]
MVRITAGEWRGRKLEVPDGIRPTTEVARKAAFDILGDAIRGARVLDACAGSGAYGLEALSRGAAHATFVEADRKVAEVLRGNVERLGATATSRLEVMSAGRFAPGRASFDVVFHDPPFKEISSESDLQLLLSVVVVGGWLFHERGDDSELSPGGVSPSDRRRYGLTRFLIYRP